ncbi:CPBP family intramembrane glutamic endopeptidase [Serpentinicella sp. ANB-PHB4]|uniref:CPBP family intramembrane glutamic endopeptidase n=1 Tax=Serpentinicella sp. ANB-PHB4 TaxID=3074076 RepID=UPI0028568A7D|nr:CPBP family intramembrane glutamic endopeptidase [Serpentinicella sp. ANB-PHB4]MDR5660006.1 CPBP family intramembrane glutamic endopeptidase [Serpentinicella sp. ANB-PHB4]
MYDIAKKINVKVDWRVSIATFILIFIFQIFFALNGLFLISGFSFCLYPIIALGFTERNNWSELGIRKPENMTSLLISILLSGVVVILSYIIFSIFIGNTSSNYFYVVSLKDIELFGINNTPKLGIMLLSGAIFCTMPALTEEIYFRGFMQKHLENRFGFKIGNFIQGLCFGLIHIAYCWLIVYDINVIWGMVPSITIVGMIYGWVRNETNSIFPAIITHSAANFIIFIIMYSIIIPEMI